MGPLNIRLLLLVGIILFSFHILSCTSTKKLIYLYDLKDTARVKINSAQNSFENLIQKNDLLWITIGGSNPQDLAILNSASGVVGSALNANNGAAIGYFVEADGKIKIPFAGSVQAEGLTRLELEKVLTGIFQDYTKNPVVNVRFLNYTYSVMGEVARSGKFNMVNERTTILEAITMAGDLTDLGRRDNVLIVREVNGQRDFARINLSSKDIFKSPFFYLKTNDVIYVEPVRAKFIARNGIPQYLSILAVGLSLLITIINLRK